MLMATMYQPIKRIVKQFNLEPGRLAKDVTDALDRLPRGSTSISDLSSHVEEAVERGVRVRMILNKGHLGSGKKKASDLAKIGVHVFALPKTIHQKFALFDASGDQLLINDHRNVYLGRTTPFIDVVIHDGYWDQYLIHSCWTFIR